MKPVNQKLATNYFGIVAAGGSGARLNPETPKQYLEINKRSILEISVGTLLNSVNFKKLVVVVPKSDMEKCYFLKEKFKQIELVAGGSTRCESVFEGLKFLDSQSRADDWCLVHDAARPCVQTKDILELIDVLKNSNTGGVLAAPVIDTLKKINDQSQIEETIERANLWKAFTPQMFRYGVLFESIRSVLENGISVSDESQALEKMGQSICIVRGSSENIKITYPEDIKKAELFFSSLKNKDVS